MKYLEISKENYQEVLWYLIPKKCHINLTDRRSTPSLLVYKTRTYNNIQTLQSLTTNLLIIFFVL
jgi:hypothetical protein